MARVENAGELRRIETANTKSAARLLAENLPDALARMSVGSLHLGDDTLNRALESIAGLGRAAPES